jgi:hypothetical protein
MAKTAPAQSVDLEPGDAEQQPQSERKGATPATAPASEPAAAVSKPATENAPRTPKTVIGSVRDPMIDFEDDPKKALVGVPEAKAADMMRKVACHVIENFQGRTKTKSGYEAFKFIRHEVVMLPKWFALSHPTRLVIKE